MSWLLADSQINIARRYHHVVVRDLAWAISSPPLLEFPHSNIHWPNKNWYQARYDESSEMLSRLDKDPAILEEFLQRGTQHRLGSYFEALWIFWLAHQQRFSLLAHNLQVNDAQRTIGEFDLIVHDSLQDKTCHWEMAVKFYLGLGNTQYLKNWLGPGLRDRFDHKLQKLQQQQTTLAHHPAGKQSLQKLDIKIDTTSVILKGRLFYNVDNATPAQFEYISHDHLRGWWCDCEDFRNKAGKQSALWYVLTKQQWLAPVCLQEDQISHIDAIVQLVNTTHEPVCVATISANEEISRGFVVPMDWTDRARDFSA